MNSQTKLRVQRFEFESWLADIHAEDYHGTDDDMADAFVAWLQRLDMQEILEYADKFAAEVRATALSAVEYALSAFAVSPDNEDADPEFMAGVSAAIEVVEELSA